MSQLLDRLKYHLIKGHHVCLYMQSMWNDTVSILVSCLCKCSPNLRHRNVKHDLLLYFWFSDYILKNSIWRKHYLLFLANINITQKTIALILFVFLPLLFLTALSVPSVLPHLSPLTLSLAPLRSWLFSLFFSLSLSLSVFPTHFSHSLCCL